MKEAEKSIMCGVVLSLLALAISACGTTVIKPPPPGLPPQLAAFSGIWEGKSTAGYEVRLVVESIDERRATIVYTLGDHPAGLFRGYSVWVTARVVGGNAIQWEEGGGIGTRYFEMDPSLERIDGSMTWGHLSASVTLTRAK